MRLGAAADARMHCAHTCTMGFRGELVSVIAHFVGAAVAAIEVPAPAAAVDTARCLPRGTYHVST